MRPNTCKSDSKYVSFGEKAHAKPSKNIAKVTKNLSDIEALLEYEGDDIDQLAMSNSKDALRIMDNIDDMIEARLNMLTQEESYQGENFNDNIFGLACF